MSENEIRIDFPIFGDLSRRAAGLLDEGLARGGLFIHEDEEMAPGQRLEVAFVHEDGSEELVVHTRVSKIRRRKSASEIFIVFEALDEARDALHRVREMAKKLPEDSAPAVEETPGNESATAGVSLVVAHPDADTREQLSRILTEAGHDVCTADDGENALTAAEAVSARAILAWARLPKTDGYALPAAVADTEGDPPAVIVLVAPDDDEAREYAQQAGARVILDYPAPAEALEEALRNALGGKT